MFLPAKSLYNYLDILSREEISISEISIMSRIYYFFNPSSHPACHIAVAIQFHSNYACLALHTKKYALKISSPSRRVSRERLKSIRASARSAMPKALDFRRFQPANPGFHGD